MRLFDGPPASVPPRWAPWTSTLLCVAGVADASYLTYSHFYTKAITSCVMNSFINCTAVTTSKWSYFLGMPVSVLGLAWAIGMLVLCSPPAWKTTTPWVGRVRLLGAVTGVAMIMWLVYAELFKIGYICEYCTVMHIITVILFFVILFGTVLAIPGDLVDGPGDLVDGDPEAPPEGFSTNPA